MKTEELLIDLIKDPENLFKALGQAFRPDLRHFSDLSEEEQAGRLREVPVLRENHEDWPFPFSGIPRRATVYFGPPPKSGSKPILKPGESFVGEGYMTLTTEDGIHVRHGFRYDDVDNYYTYVPITIKRQYADDEETLGKILDVGETSLFIASMFFPQLKTAAGVASLINRFEELSKKLPDVDPSLLKHQEKVPIAEELEEAPKFDLPRDPK